MNSKRLPLFFIYIHIDQCTCEFKQTWRIHRSSFQIGGSARERRLLPVFPVLKVIVRLGYTHTHTYIYIYSCGCVGVRVCVEFVGVGV